MGGVWGGRVEADMEACLEMLEVVGRRRKCCPVGRRRHEVLINASLRLRFNTQDNTLESVKGRVKVSESHV